MVKNHTRNERETKNEPGIRIIMSIDILFLQGIKKANER